MNDKQFKSEAERAIDEVEAIANRLRDRLLTDAAATAGYVKLRILVIACAICLLFGFIAGHHGS